MELSFLQKRYPKFIYQSYSYNFKGKNLQISFDFRIEPSAIALRARPDIRLTPKLTIFNCLISDIKQIENMVFHLGLIEMISYWKATCSPTIEIKCGYLNKKQIKWWQDLIKNGLGQFFYENKIPFQNPKIRVVDRPKSDFDKWKSDFHQFKSKILVPIGGGKDSIVTLELLKKAKKKIKCCSLNPTDSAKKIMRAAGCKNPIIVQRKIDKKLLQLNRKGFLNGHTPFSAYLALLSVLVASILNCRYIAVSNERSSNEGNVKYKGRTVNHQWSKSFDFEQKFREYSKKHLSDIRFPSIEYFSFLRPLYELQIAKLFARQKKYFPLFLSCNEAYKTASGTKKPTKKWCGKCSKCLFAFVILYPFLNEEKLIKIFGKNLFEDKSLLPIMQELTGEKRFKPFECVGTEKETLAAFYLSWMKNREQFSDKPPFLLRYFEKKIMPKHPGLRNETEAILNSWGKENNSPKNLEKILKNEIK